MWLSSFHSIFRSFQVWFSALFGWLSWPLCSFLQMLPMIRFFPCYQSHIFFWWISYFYVFDLYRWESFDRLKNYDAQANNYRMSLINQDVTVTCENILMSFSQIWGVAVIHMCQSHLHWWFSFLHAVVSVRHVCDITMKQWVQFLSWVAVLQNV